MAKRIDPELVREALGAEPRALDAEAEFRRYAVELGGATARAANEGYDVRTAVLEEILAQLLCPFCIEPKPPSGRRWDLAGTMHETGTKYEERNNPDEHAFAVLDSIRGLVAAVEKPACVELKVSRVMRATKTSSSSALPDQKFTAVLVTVRSPITKPPQVVVYRVEGP